MSAHFWQIGHKKKGNAIAKLTHTHTHTYTGTLIPAHTPRTHTSIAIWLRSVRTTLSKVANDFLAEYEMLAR